MPRVTRPPQEQIGLDFTSTIGETLAMLRRLPAKLTNLPPDLAAGVADLLERVAICAHDRTTSHARAAKLAAGLTDRRPVSERTVRRWRVAAESVTTSAGPLLQTVHRSHLAGGHRTNAWSINWPAVRALLDPAPDPAPKSAQAPPRPTTAAQRLADLAATLDEATAARCLAWLASATQSPAATPLSPAGRVDTDRTPTGHHGHPRTGHHGHPTVNQPENPPTTADWQGVEEQLAAWGLAQAADLATLARTRGERPADFLARAQQALATAQANAPTAGLRSPRGATAWYLRTGEWPGGLQLRPPAELATRLETTAHKIHAATAERLEYAALAELKTRRAAGQDLATIRADLNRRYPAAILARCEQSAAWPWPAANMETAAHG